jgi:hypothetical protein
MGRLSGFSTAGLCVRSNNSVLNFIATLPEAIKYGFHKRPDASQPFRIIPTICLKERSAQIQLFQS